jgi:hypothetical protein
MTAQVFPIDAETIAGAKAYAAIAEKPENWYRPFGGSPIPGDNPHGKLYLGTHSVVFTWSVAQDGSVHRHMSIRSRGSAYAMPYVVFTAAHWLGFRNAEVDEHGIVKKAPESWTIVVGEPVEAAK